MKTGFPLTLAPMVVVETQMCVVLPNSSSKPMGVSLDEELKYFFLCHPPNDAFLCPNHNLHFSFTLVCLWNQQIQFKNLVKNLQKKVFFWLRWDPNL